MSQIEIERAELNIPFYNSDLQLALTGLGRCERAITLLNEHNTKLLRRIDALEHPAEPAPAPEKTTWTNEELKELIGTMSPTAKTTEHIRHHSGIGVVWDGYPYYVHYNLVVFQILGPDLVSTDSAHELQTILCNAAKSQRTEE